MPTVSNAVAVRARDTDKIVDIVREFTDVALVVCSRIKSAAHAEGRGFQSLRFHILRT